MPLGKGAERRMGLLNVLDSGDGLLAVVAVGIFSSWAANCFYKNQDVVRNLSVEDTAL
jgi:hydrogenase/urease accessory protein HupE